jgi:glycosyltransferase involved in cell wall biosynthesis
MAKILLINVFFWPDAVGGATRVVMDQAKTLSAAGEEVTILCSAKNSRGDYKLDIAAWENCRLVRLHAPLKPWDWHNDQGCYGFMDNFLKQEHFDRVHAHSIQVLTADILQPVVEHGLPLDITLHDGWWLGRHQFFTTLTGQSITPGDWIEDLDLPISQRQRLNQHLPKVESIFLSLWQLRQAGIVRFKEKGKALGLLEAETLHWNDHDDSRKAKVAERFLNEKKTRVERMSAIAEEKDTAAVARLNIALDQCIPDQQFRQLLYNGFCRSRDLRCVLSQADHRYAVSASFAALYREAGILNVEVLENISLPQPALERIRLCDERGVVFGFIGGWSLHKGIGILEEACRLYEGEPCTLLAIHEAAKLNPQISFHWGRVQVKLVAPVPLEQTPDLYARFDVLIAPSTWPESFGLVTREAASAGKLVIASAIGALADLKENQALVIPVPPSDPERLAMAMMNVAASHGTPALKPG